MTKAIRHTLAIALLAACGTTPARPDEPSSPEPSHQTTADPCAGGAFTVVATPPAPGGPAAELSVARRGEGMGADAARTCVRIGDRAVVVEPGVEARFEVAAHAQDLQRVVVGGHAVLVVIEPNGTLHLGDQPCFGWALSATWLDPFAVDGDRAYCRDVATECRAGYSQAGPPGPVEEPLCAEHGEEDSARRCLRNAEVRFVGPTSASLRLHRFGDEAGEAIALGASPVPTRELSPTATPWHCGEPEVATNAERAMLLLPAAARVEVMVDEDGALSARLAP